MFTQQHYEKTADLINSKRLEIRARLGRDYLTSLEITTLNDLTMGFVAMFRKDNPKFKELIFIERCNRDLNERN